MVLSSTDADDLACAVRLLENPGFIARVSNFLGKPVEISMNLLPKRLAGLVQFSTRKALTHALKIAVLSLDNSFRGEASNRTHKFLAGFSGIAGGMFGLPALSVELPVSTALILRSIADIARSEGEDIRSVDTQLACVEVFALGGRNISDDAAESGYFAVRAALARQLSDAAQYILTQGVSDQGAPALVRFVAQVAARYGIVVSEKAAAQMLPVIGAALGGAVNILFTDHFQDMARGHFIVRRLEREYGRKIIEREYRKIRETL